MPIDSTRTNRPALQPLNFNLPADATTISAPSTTTTTTTTTGFSLGNTFESQPTHSELSPAVRARAESATNTFNERLRTILHHDAMSLAAGHTPVRSGDQLTDAQRNELMDASKDMFMDLPIGALSPAATSELRSYLDRQGISTENLETKTLKDLGSVGGDLAKKWAGDLKDESPAVYYGLLGAAGAAVGAYGYLQGSDALKKLGIKPEFKTSLFDDQIKVKAEAMWDKRFRDPNLVADVDGRFNLSSGSALSLRINSHIDARNLDSSTGSTNLRWGTDANHLEAGVRANTTGIDGYNLSGRATSGNFSVYGNAAFDRDMSFSEGRVGSSVNFNGRGSANLDLTFGNDGSPTRLEGGLTYREDNFNVRGSLNADFVRDTTSVELSAGYRPTENLELGVRGSYNNRDGAYAGVGLTWNF